MKIKPRAYIFTGTNASGKSTFITFLLENNIINGIYINANLILKEELKLDETKENYFKAFRIEAKRIKRNIRQKNDLIIEVTTSKNVVYNLKKAGYYITYIFLGTKNPKINAVYLAQRVQEGGHDVLMKDLIRRWEQTLKNLKEIKKIADCLILIDNSDISNPPSLLKSYFQGQLCYINDEINLSKIQWLQFINDENEKFDLTNINTQEFQFCEFIKNNLTYYANDIKKSYKEKNKILLSYSKKKPNPMKSKEIHP